MDRVCQAVLTTDHIDQLNLRTCKIDSRWNAVQVGTKLCLLHRIFSGTFTDQQFVAGRYAHVVISTQCCGGIALGIQVHNQHFKPIYRKASRQIDSSCGFTHPAFLVRNRNSSRAVWARKGQRVRGFHPRRALRSGRDGCVIPVLVVHRREVPFSIGVLLTGKPADQPRSAHYSPRLNCLNAHMDTLLGVPRVKHNSAQTKK